MKLKTIINISCMLLVLFSLTALIGCGDKSQQSYSPPPSEGMEQSLDDTNIDGQQTTKIDPNQKLEFSDLSLSSDVSVLNKSGVKYMQFEYEDSDGKIYKTIVPEAMTQGAYTPSEWQSTFRVYRAKDETPREAPKPQNKDEMTDFPFIAPRESSEEKQEATRQQPTRRPVAPPSSRPTRSTVPYQPTDDE